MGLGFRVKGLGFRFEGSVLRDAEASGFRDVWGSGCVDGSPT